MAKTKRPKRKMVLDAYNRKKILPRYPFNLKLYKKKLENLKWFRRYKQFEVLPFLSKIRKFKMALLIYPVGQKFHRNRSISHGLGDTSNLKFYHFCQKFENSKWAPFLERGKIF